MDARSASTGRDLLENIGRAPMIEHEVGVTPKPLEIPKIDGDYSKDI